MSTQDPFADVVAANSTYAGMFTPVPPGPAARRLAVLTCMDARIDPLPMLGLARGDAYVVRNAGARVSEGVLETLTLANHLLGVERLMVVAHTQCRMSAPGPESLHAAISDAGGPDTRSISFLTSDDVERSVANDVQRVLSWPYLRDLAVGGFVYDVTTGRLRRIC